MRGRRVERGAHVPMRVGRDAYASERELRRERVACGPRGVSLSGVCARGEPDAYMGSPNTPNFFEYCLRVF